MDLFVQLKVCEGCGSLWYRVQNQETVYCRECEIRLKDFAAPATRRRRRASSRIVPFQLQPEAPTAGGER